jgi:hypothetical protein
MRAEVARLSRSPGRRDRWFIAAILLATAAISVGIVLNGPGGSHPSAARAGCVRAERPGFMGATLQTWCGAAATKVCRTAGAERELARQCAALARTRTAG